MNFKTAWALIGLSGGLLSLAGCGGNDSTEKSGEDSLPPPAIGVQLASGSYTLAAGDEQYMCWGFQVPDGQAIALTNIEQQIPKTGVHHYGVFTSTLPFDGSKEPYECFSMGVDWGLVTGGGVGTPGLKFPEGTSMNIKGGQHLILQLHLLNATDKPLEIKPARVNLIGAENAEGLQPVGLVIGGSNEILIPKKSSDVSVTGSCTLEEPLENIFAVFPHMHQLGRRLKAEVIPATGTQRVISDQEWDFGDQGVYSVQANAAVGDQLEITCIYDNPTDVDVGFGLKTNQEMCVEVLYHWPAKSMNKYCNLP